MHNMDDEEACVTLTLWRATYWIILLEEKVEEVKVGLNCLILYICF